MTFMDGMKFTLIDNFFSCPDFSDTCCVLSNAMDFFFFDIPRWVYSYFISMRWSSTGLVHNANQVHMTASLMTVVIYQSVWLIPCLGWKQMSLQSPIYWRSDVWQTVLTWFTSLDADAELARQRLKPSARAIVPPIRGDSFPPHAHTKTLQGYDATWLKCDRWTCLAHKYSLWLHSLLIGFIPQLCCII